MDDNWCEIPISQVIGHGRPFWGLLVLSPVSNIYVWTATSGVSANRDQSAGAGNEQAALASRPPRLTTQLLPCVFLHGFRDLRLHRIEAEASALQGRSLQCL